MRLLLATLGVTLLVGCGGPAPTTSLAPGPPSSSAPTSTSAPTTASTSTSAPTSTSASTVEATSTSAPTVEATSTSAPTVEATSTTAPPLEPTTAPTAEPTSTTAPPLEPITALTAEPTSTTAPVLGEAQAAIDGFGYLPEPVKVRVGGTVTWTNLDLTLHSATADDGSFNSGLLSQGQTFAHTFTEPGEFPYYCSRHGGMVGRVIVAP